MGKLKILDVLVNYYNYIKIHDVIAKNTSVAQDSEAICRLRSLSPLIVTTDVSNQQFLS